MQGLESSEERTGGCLCGAVRYSVRGAPLRVGLCHCADCRKTSGSAFVTFAVWPRAAFSVAGDIASHAGRSFCPLCGSRLFCLRPEEAEINVGSLDDAPTGLEPTYELWTRRRERWLPPLAVATQYDEDREQPAQLDLLDATSADPSRPGDLERAMEVAATAHMGQTGKNGEPKVEHCRRVAAAVDSVDEKIVAWLHDVIEKNPDWTTQRLLSHGFSEAVVDAVDAMTRRMGEDYLDFARRAAANPLARPVKVADLEDNLAASRNAGKDGAKYRDALALLRRESAERSSLSH